MKGIQTITIALAMAVPTATLAAQKTGSPEGGKFFSCSKSFGTSKVGAWILVRGGVGRGYSRRSVGDWDLMSARQYGSQAFLEGMADVKVLGKSLRAMHALVDADSMGATMYRHRYAGWLFANPSRNETSAYLQVAGRTLVDRCGITAQISKSLSHTLGSASVSYPVLGPLRLSVTGTAQVGGSVTGMIQMRSSILGVANAKAGPSASIRASIGGSFFGVAGAEAGIRGDAELATLNAESQMIASGATVDGLFSADLTSYSLSIVAYARAYAFGEEASVSHRIVGPITGPKLTLVDM